MGYIMAIHNDLVLIPGMGSLLEEEGTMGHSTELKQRIGGNQKLL